MTRIIAFVNQKGGVAKTTSTVNVGAGLVKHGKTVLLVDLDPQGNLTTSLGLQDYDSENTMYEILTDQLSVNEAIVKADGGYDVIPAYISLSGAELELSSQPGRELVLKEALQPIVKLYDYILIDCPPSLGLLTLNGLTAAKEIFIFCKADFLALNGMSQLLKTVKIVQKRLNPVLEITGIVVTFYDQRKIHNRDVLASIEKYFKNSLFETKIRNNVALAEAPADGKDIYQHKADSNGAEDYTALCLEVIKQETECKQ
jgi:chromosome partitioning protein